MMAVQKRATPKPREQASGWVETVKTLLYAGAIAFSVRTIAFEPFNIPSGSMIPTLLVGDFVFVSKYSYGYSRYSIPLSPPVFGWTKHGRVLEGLPKRGDVAVFRFTKDTSIDYIKRVIGLPGDKIQVKGGILHINSKPVKREKVGEFQAPIYAGYNIRVTEYVETLPNGVKHRIWEERDDGFDDNTKVYTVPPGRYFMMGDNRDMSRDSRYAEVGFVPFENLIGRAEFLFYSHDDSAEIWEFWNWPGAIRFSRIFNGIG